MKDVWAIAAITLLVALLVSLLVQYVPGVGYVLAASYGWFLAHVLPELKRLGVLDAAGSIAGSAFQVFIAPVLWVVSLVWVRVLGLKSNPFLLGDLSFVFGAFVLVFSWLFWSVFLSRTLKALGLWNPFWRAGPDRCGYSGGCPCGSGLKCADSPADAARSRGRRECQSRRNIFHTAPPAVKVTMSWDDRVADAGFWSGSQYSHSPKSLQMRALTRPCWRQRPSSVLEIPSVTQACLRVSMPASSKRSLRLLSLAERRTHWTLAESNASPAPVRSPRSLRRWATCALVYSSRSA